VLIACDHIDYDGALHGGGRQLVELVQALDRRLVEPTVCILRSPTRLGLELKREGLPLRFFGDHRFNPLSAWKFARLIRARKIDVLHLTDFGACTFGRIAGRLHGTPSIVQIIAEHTEHQARGFPKSAELAYRALAPGTARALAISSSTKDFAVRRMGFASEAVEVLHYPLPRHSFSAPQPEEVCELRQRLGIDPGVPVVGAVTRFYPAKGIRYLLGAFGEIHRQMPGARLLLVGQGPEEVALKRQCAALGLEGAVIFAGFQRRPQAYVATFDVAVVPSLEEAFGLVAVEALSLGVPVVASRVGGLADVVEDGRTGLLVEAADPDGIATAVLRLLRDAGLRERMSFAALGVAERFSLDGYVARLTQIYHELSRHDSVVAPEPHNDNEPSNGQ
jgi:glycosyltransferase involved in cell wall biosynthesis